MKKLLFFLVAVTMSLFVSAQTVVFQEGFEVPGGINMLTTADSAGFSTTNFTPWSLSTHLAKSGVRSDSNRVQTGKTIFLTTNSFSTVGNTYVILEFSQICKLHFADGGQIEVSTNGGTSWSLLTAAYYQGSGVMALNKFSESSYNNDWMPGDTLVKPTNAWWRNEKFDISAIAANQANVKIRFKFNGSGNPTGFGRYGWLLDDIKVTASPSELVAPTMTMVAYPTDTLYSAGPYTVSAYVNDNTGIDTVFTTYKIGNGNFMQLGMTKSPTIDSLYSAGIPFPGWGKKITYYVTAVDASTAHNTTVKPNTGYYSFFTKYSNGGTYIIGNGTLTSYFYGPMYRSSAASSFDFSRYSYLFTAAEMAAAGVQGGGNITNIEWYKTDAFATSGGASFSIYLKNSTQANLTSPSDWTSIINGATQVYTTTNQNIPSTIGWIPFPVSTFAYNGGGLEVSTDWDISAVAGNPSTGAFNWQYTGGLTGNRTLGNANTAVGTSLSTGSYGGIIRPNMRITISVPGALTQDAGIAQITNPTGGVTANQAFNLEAKIKNFGTSSLTKASIKYSIDNGAPVSYAWNGPALNQDSVSPSIVIGNLNLNVGPHALKVWSEMPNDSIDQNNGNDTAYVNFYACASQLSGNYTIGGTNPNFVTFAEALVGLTQCGINGPVTFNVAAGNYPEQLTIPEISGASATNTITFKAANNDSTSVVMNYLANASANWIVKLDGADYITFKNIKFAPADSTNSKAVIITNGATYNKFIGNIFAGYYGTGDDLRLLTILSGNNTYNQITGNYFIKGSRAIDVKGTANLPLDFNIINKNVINDFQVYGIYAQYANNLLIDSNTVITSVINANKYGIYAQYANHFVQISKNNVNLTGGTNMYGILTENCISADSSKGLIANNMVSVLNGTNFAYGIRLNATTKYKVYFNSVLTEGANVTDTRALNLVSSSVRIEVLNNNLQSNKYPLHVEGSSDTICNYNNYYSTGTTFAYWGNTTYSNLNALKAATLKDSNSVNINPLFNSVNDLHTFNGLLFGIGTPLAEVTTDIDGTLRSNNPCIGADEFIPPPNDAAIIAILEPIGGCGMTTTENVKIVIKNVGTAVILPNTLTARYKIDSLNAVVSELVNRTVNQGDTIHYTFTTKANLSVDLTTYNDTTYNIRSWVDLTGDYAHANDTTGIKITSLYLPTAPTASNINIPYATSGVVTAVSNKPLIWYDSPTSTTPIGTGLSYTTPILYLTDTFYVEAKTSMSANLVLGSGTTANSTTSFPAPYGNYFWGAKHQILVTKAELNAQGFTGGPLTYVGLDVQAVGGAAMQNFEIKVGHTALPALATGNWISGLSSVFSVPSYTETVGWNIHNFSTPFVWNGNDNVVIEFCFNNSAYTTNALTKYTPTTFNSVAFTYGDNAGNCTSTSSSQVSMNRPNLKIGANVLGCTSPRIPVVVIVAPQPPYEPLLTKVSVPNQGCGLGNEQVSITVKNIGTATLTSGLNATYKIDNGAFITPEAITAPIPAGDSIVFTFNTLANLTAVTQDTYFKITAALNYAYPNNLLQNDTLAKDSIYSQFTPQPPTTSNVSIFYGAQATLNATSTNNIYWYDSPNATNYLAMGASYTTPYLYLTDTFYVAAKTGFSANVTIGNGTLAQGWPFYTFYMDSRTEMLYKATELQAQGLVAGSITSLAFDFTVVDPALINGMVINMQNYTPSTLTGFNSAGWTQVYSSNYTVPGTGWQAIQLQTPFTWDGTSNVLISLCFDNAAYTANSSVNTSNVAGSVYHAHTDLSAGNGCTDITSGSTYADRPNVKFIANVSGCGSAKVPVIVTVAPPPQNDAGVSAMVSPIGSTPSGIATPIKVKLKNYGQAALTNAKIAWRLNGAVKPVYNFTGNIASGAESEVTIGTETFAGGLYCVKAWAFDPNNVMDSVASNDTLFNSCFTACLNGTYTIGDTTGGNFHHFPTFNSAVTTLKIAGVCGNVTFLVDTGTYNEQVRITEIAGASATSTITFRSASNDSTKVKLQFNAASSTANYTLSLDSADYIRIEKMTIRALNTTYGYVIDLRNGAQFNIFRNNIIENPTTTTSYTSAGIYETTTPNHYNKYMNNIISYGYYGIYTNGSSGLYRKGTEISNNKINNFYYYGIYSAYQDSVKIIGNELTSNASNTYIYGLYTYYNSNASRVLKNKINLNTPGTQYGLYVYYCTATDTTKALYANNMIALNGGTSSSTNYAMYLYYSNHQNIYYNTANVSVNSLTYGRTLYQTGGTFLNLVNNNISNTGDGVAYYIGTPTAIGTSNYNNIYSSGPVLGYWSANQNNLAALKTASGKDANSLSVYPNYYSNNDLHLLSTDLSAYGTPLTSVNDDIDGQLRDILNPTIGADEVTRIPKDAGVIAIQRPTSVETEGSMIPVKVLVKNFGTDTIYTMPIYYKVNNGTPVLFNYNGLIAPLATDTAVYLPNMIVPAGNANICAYTALAGDSNTFNNQICKNFFGTPLNDAQLVKILPLSEGCGLTTDTVIVMIKNKGLNPMNTTYFVSYYRIGDPISNIITEPVSILINPGDSVLYAFNTLVDLSVTTLDSNYHIKAWVTLLQDNVAVNDTAYRNAKSLHTPLDPIVNNVSIPYGTTANLVATSVTNDPLYWFDVPAAGTAIFNGGNYITPYLYATDTFYVEAKTGFSANVTINPGVTPTTQGWPFYTFYMDSRTEMLYKASELLAQNLVAGSITSVAFDINSVGSPAMNGFTIKMQNYAPNTLTAFNATGWTTVYTGTYTPPAIGWQEIPLQTPFNWDGVSNVLISICFDNSSYTSNSLVNSSNVPGSVYHSHSDLSAGNGCTELLTGTVYADRPNIKLIANVAGCASQRLPAIVNVGPQSPKDAGVIEIVDPSTAVNLTNHEVIKVKIKNFGLNPISNFNIRYRVDNNPVVTQLVTDTIAANDTLEKTFNVLANLSSNTQPQTFVLKAWTALANDATSLNDTCKKSVINNKPVYCPSNANYTYYENIGQVIFAGINNGSATPVLSNPLANKMYSNFTDSTASNYLGTILPGMTHPISVNLIWLNSSAYAGYCKVFIDYNRNGNWDLPNELAYEGSYSGSSTSLIGNITVPFTALPGFTRMRIVAQYGGSTTSVLPCGTYGYGETEDYRIMILPPIPHDAGIAHMNNMNNLLPYYAQNTQQPQFFIRNYGSDTLASAMVKINVNGTIYDHPWPTTPIPALQSLGMDSMQQVITIQPGMNYIKAYTVLAGDTNYMNDTISRKVFKEYATTPNYFDNFENNEYFYAIDTADYGIPINNLWKQGVPKASFIPTVPSGTKVWATNLDTNYVVNNTSILYSPVFLINPMQADSLKFWQWRKFGNGASGTIEYKNSNNSWIPLGDTNDVNATNWFNNSAKVWNDSTTNWVKSTYKLSNLTNLGSSVQFRFIFKTTATASPLKYGWTIDDFEVTLLPLPADGGVTAIITPNATQLVGDNVTVKVTVKNFGTDPLTNIPVKYKASTGSAIVSGTIPGPLASGASIDYTFTQKYAVATSSFSICAFTTVTGDIYVQNDSSCRSVTVNPAANDVGIIEIINPGASANTGQVIYPKVVIKNFGTTPKTSIPLSYQRGSLTPVTGTWTGNTLNIGDTAHFTFTTPFTVPAGASISLAAFTTLANDAYAPNNKVTKSVQICNMNISGITINGPSNPDFGQTGVAYFIDSVSTATSYTWSYSGTGVTINGNGTRNITIDIANNATNGILTVTASNANCTSNPITKSILISVNEIDGSNFWLGQNMPNPTNGLTTIAYSLPSTGEVSFNIVNLYGQSVYSFRNVVEEGRHMIDLNVNDLAAGVYYYTVEFKGKRLVKKMVVNK